MRRGRRCGPTCSTGAAALPSNIAAYFELIDDFQPEVVISDFESWTYLYAKTHRLPILSIDNMQIINRCTHPPEVIAGARGRVPAHQGVRQEASCRSATSTSSRRSSTRRCARSAPTLFPPILRPEILAAKPRRGEHLLVYQTAEGNDGARRRRWRRPGSSAGSTACAADLTEEQVEGNLRYRPFSEAGFIDDLASCARGDRGRRLHADGRGRLPAQADARGAARRASSSRCSTRATSSAGLRPVPRTRSDPAGHPRLPRRRSPSARSAWPDTSRTATSGSMRSWTGISPPRLLLDSRRPESSTLERET